MYTQGGVTYTPFAERLKAFLSESNCLSGTRLGGRAPSSQSLSETTIFSLIVHAHSCY